MIAFLKEGETIDDVIAVLRDHVQEAIDGNMDNQIIKHRERLLEKALKFKAQNE